MVTTSFRAAETGDTGAGGGGRLSARAKTPGRLAPAGREAGHAGASPVTLPVCDVSGMFFPDVMFLWLPCRYCSSSFSSSSSFRSSPVYGFPGRPPGGAGCRERSQRSCLRPGGLPSLTRNPGLQRPFRSRRLCRAALSRRDLRSRHPGKRRRDVRRNAVSRTRSPSLRRVPAHCLPGAIHPYESLSPGADTATTCRTDCPG